MPSSSWALQQSVHAALTADTDLVTVLGGPRIYDDAPQSTHYPYLTLGQSLARDWSTGSEDGEEHILTLHVWSHGAGKRETFEIMGKVRQALHDRALVVAGHRLVNLRCEFADARREPDGESYHGIVRYRAVTEPAG